MNTQYPQPEVHPNLYYYRPPAPFPSRPVITADVCVYGATAAGVVAAAVVDHPDRGVWQGLVKVGDGGGDGGRFVVGR